MDSLFIRALLNDNVKLKPKFVTKNSTKFILERLKKTFEGCCTYHGYIKVDSIEIVKVSCGLIKDVTLNGDTIFNVTYYADVCNPIIGSVVSAKVVNTNMFGILAENGLNINGKYYPILEIIVAKNANAELDKIKVGSQIDIEVIGKKYELEDKKITVVGKVVEEKKGGNVKNEIEGTQDEEDDEADVEEFAGDVDGDEDEDGVNEEEEEDGKSEYAESVDSFESNFSDIEDGSVGGEESDKSNGGDLSD